MSTRTNNNQRETRGSIQYFAHDSSILGSSIHFMTTSQLQQNLGNQFFHRLIRSGIIQRKTRVSRPSDDFEKEADIIAEKIVQMNPSTPMVTIGKEGTFTRRETVQNQVGRKCKSCELDRKMDEEKELRISRKSPEEKADVSENSEQNIDNTLRDVGSSLDTHTRKSMESKFSYDFSDVKVHTNDQDSRSARSLNALAYTVGDNIVFEKGQYAPHTREGERLLAHELTHVVQQKISLGKKHTLRPSGNNLPIAKTTLIDTLFLNGIVFRQGIPPKVPIPQISDEVRKLIQIINAEASKQKKAELVIISILDKYYPTERSKVNKVTYEAVGKDKKPIMGLETPIPVGATSDYKGEIIVGSYYLDNIKEDTFAHRVLQVGHELQHIDQYGTGLGKSKSGSDPFKHKREFLAHYWETFATTGLTQKAPTPASGPPILGTGRIRPITRLKMIDCALANFYYLSATDQKQPDLISKKDSLLDRRKEMYSAAIARLPPGDPQPPADPPTTADPQHLIGCG